jgi:hypothetical protein
VQQRFKVAETGSFVRRGIAQKPDSFALNETAVEVGWEEAPDVWAEAAATST